MSIYLNNVSDNLPLIVGQLTTTEDVEYVLEMTEVNGDTHKFHTSDESVGFQSIRITLNLLSHILISLVVLVCLWFSCRLEKMSVIELHIVLCVLGYQFFMSHGILVLSKFNSWLPGTLNLRHRRSLHWLLELIGILLILVGSIEVIKYKVVHFNTLHGILGLCALITTVISVLNGLLTSFATKFTRYGVNLTTTSKWLHGVTGIGTLFLSTASLHYGYNKGSFRRWIDNDNCILIIKIFTWMFIIFIAFEFWIITSKRIYYKTRMPNAPVK